MGSPGWSVCTVNCLYLFCDPFRGAYSPQAPLAFGIALEVELYDGIAPPSTAALNATYRELATAKRRQKSRHQTPKGEHRAPWRPEGDHPPNPRAPSHPRGSSGADGGLRGWSVCSWAAPHGHIELIASSAPVAVGHKGWCVVPLVGPMVALSRGWASGDVLWPLGSPLGWWWG